MKVTECRLCKGKLSEPKLKFPDTPLANEFVSSPDEKQDLFPLEICVCESCEHYQLSISVPPERLFRHYLFVAGTSPVNVEHFRQYALNVIDKYGLKSGSKILDIASNDGTLLKHFQNLGMKVLGIDPAKNIAEEANKNGIETIPEFFTEESSIEILNKYGKFDFISANNVFAHVPDLIGFAKGVRNILSDNGVFSFEVSYFADVCDKVLFDTCYHEHTSYHTIGPLISFFKYHDMELFDVEHIDTHGGSVRVFVRKTTNKNEYQKSLRELRINSLLDREIDMEQKIIKLRNKIHDLGLKLRETLNKYKDKTIAIYGVPAKATTLLFALNIDEKLISFAIDDNPLKQNMFVPGKHVSVLNTNSILEKKPDIILILAWNFSSSIIEKCKKIGYIGKFIVPIPDLIEI